MGREAMIILVTGGRTYDKVNVVYMALDAVHRKRGITLLVEGGARGADGLARAWAGSRGVPCITCHANWKKYGPSVAGKIRNAAMLSDHKPDAVVAFRGGTGTADMVKKAKAAGVPVWEVNDRE